MNKLTCQKCSRKGQVFVPYTTPKKKVSLVVVGEAPGKQEIATCQAFVGPAGQKLRAELPCPDSEVAFLNACQCGTSKPKIMDIRYCDAQSEIKSWMQKGVPVILAGEYAQKAWFHTTRIAGVGHLRGYLEPCLYATYHPSACLRDDKYTPWMKGDLEDAYKKNSRRDVQYQVDIIGSERDFPRFEGEDLTFDIETSGVIRKKDKFNLACIYHPSTGRVLQINKLELLRTVFKNKLKGCKIIGHDVKFDCIFPEVELGDNHVEDTRILLKIVKSGLPGYGLVRLSEDFLGYRKWWIERGIRDKFRDQAENCARDVVATWGLYDRFGPDRSKFARPYEVSTNALEAFIGFEREGIPIESTELDKLIEEHRVREADAADKILVQVIKDKKLSIIKQEITSGLNKEQRKKLSGAGLGAYINLNSPAQVCRLLYDIYGIPLGTTKYEVDRSTDSYTLAVLGRKGGHNIASRFADYNKVGTDLGLLEAIRETFLHEGSIYPQHHVEGADTGRTSCSLPNTQQNKARHMVQILRLGRGQFLGKVDWSQIELRCLAHISRDRIMADAYRAGLDLHTQTQKNLKNLFGVDAERRECKVINFGLVYGMSAYGLQRELFEVHGVDRPLDFCEALIEAKRLEWPGVAAWMEEAKADVSRAVNLIGRERILTESYWRAYRQKLNHPVQSFADDISKTALYHFWRELKPEWGRIIWYKHDEVAFIGQKRYLPEIYDIYQRIFSNWILQFLLDDPSTFDIPIYGEFTVAKK